MLSSTRPDPLLPFGSPSVSSLHLSFIPVSLSIAKPCDPLYNYSLTRSQIWGLGSLLFPSSIGQSSSPVRSLFHHIHRSPCQLQYQLLSRTSSDYRLVRIPFPIIPPLDGVLIDPQPLVEAIKGRWLQMIARNWTVQTLP